ncbi:hypothetical protein T459_26042 [Capsicum annuum]|uniref:PPM-type phosphatase domain-containing protein n=1 Tax=Capsicum annuum TaxID=4072 RepID=A0A2G2YMG5_CAPAN|nr:hypothetical protein T459_26042 [Capsicum annuum]
MEQLVFKLIELIDMWRMARQNKGENFNIVKGWVSRYGLWKSNWVDALLPLEYDTIFTSIGGHFTSRLFIEQNSIDVLVAVIERRRVEELGGFIADGYLNGVLSVTRALGDWDMKLPRGFSPPLLAEPEFGQIILNEDNEFLIIVCQEPCDGGLRLNTFDNLTVVIVCFTSLDHPELSQSRQRRLRCCSFSAEALCSLQSWLDNSGSR